MKAINVGIIGMGTVGTGVYKLLLKNSTLIEKKVGCPVRVAGVADLDIQRQREVGVPNQLFTTDAYQLINDPEIHIIVELIGGYDEAGDYLIEASRKGKNIVTANKALLAEKGDVVIREIEKKDVEIGFEGSVAGGIPVLKALRESLAGNVIQEIFGIINGTSNYILTRMSQEGVDFSRVLEEAQKRGLAEADPTLDVDGIDSAHKLSILIWLTTGKYPEFKDVYVEGIREITPMDLEFAGEFGYEIKLLAIAKWDGEEIEARVHPTMIPRGHLLSTVGGAYNAIYITGDFVGPVLFFGSGAGMDPTASAVVGDIIDIGRNMRAGSKKRLSFSGYERDGGRIQVKDVNEVIAEYYLRFIVIDKPGVLSKISGILGKNDISISSVIQKVRKKEEDVPIVILTHEAKEKDLKRALQEIDELDVVLDKTRLIRIESNL
jgi:homoserine dehydrogenase